MIILIRVKRIYIRWIGCPAEKKKVFNHLFNSAIKFSMK